MQDHSVLREGVPAAHKKYGVPSTMNAAIYAHFLALNRLRSLNDPKAMILCTQHMIEMYEGQGIDIYWRENHTYPSVKEYEEMVKRSKDKFRTMSRI
jgi:geranylgeranyl diphosphate synthase type 3